jgi:transcription termination factor NusB
MTNNTTNNETGNTTADTIVESSILDTLMDNLMYVGGAVVIVALACVVAWMKVPAFRLQVRKLYAKLMRQHKDELEELYEKYLTKAMKAKLSVTQKAKVQAAILEKAILSEVDHRVKKTEVALAKEIRDMAKGL